jgi:hypothetical protein
MLLDGRIQRLYVRDGVIELSVWDHTEIRQLGESCMQKLGNLTFGIAE